MTSTAAAERGRPLTNAERQARYRAKVREQGRAIHLLLGVPMRYRTHLQRIIAVERTQLRAQIARLALKRGEDALAERRDAERMLRWWDQLAQSQGLAGPAD